MFLFKIKRDVHYPRSVCARFEIKLRGCAEN
jgi:hypothetical protein